MKTLNAPLFELNPECDYYQTLKTRKDNQPRINEILANIAKEFGFDVKEFSLYGSRKFGFRSDTEAYQKFKEELTKNPDRNGIHTFKSSTKTFKAISPKLVEVDKINNVGSAFILHDIFGWNNLVASQWVDDRLFFEVKSEDNTWRAVNDQDRRKQFEVEPVKEIDYKEYLTLIMNKLGDE